MSGNRRRHYRVLFQRNVNKSTMERSFNPRIEKQSIYEIYRACRLCGAGAGYKMPIIQNVVDLDDQEVQLKQKIRDCVQIEVHQDDKMPPLICELCVDKVNDFYEFLDMCRQTNIRTRLRLGLPPQSLPRGAPDAGDCILGLTETVYINSDEDEPLVKRKRPPISQKIKVRKEPEVRIKIEKCPTKIEPRSTRHKTRREPTPPRVTRHSKSSKDCEGFSRLQENPKSSRSSKPGPKSILKKEVKSKSEDTSLLTPRLKRPRDYTNNKTETSNKKVKLVPPSPPRSRAARGPPPPAPRRPPSPPSAYDCAICHMNAKNKQGLTSHMKSHFVGFTSAKLSCNACGVWFSSGEEALAHHRRHKSRGRPYTCRRCTADFKHQGAYDEHFDKNQCIPYDIVPDVKCDTCWHQFATHPLLDAHRCPGVDGRPGGKCPKCNRTYMLLKNLKRHEETCTARRKGELIVDPELLGKLKPIQVRVARCDPLLDNIKQEHYDVSTVSSDFGLDRSCVYPYISSVSSLRIKSEPEDFDSMVTIKQEIKEEFCTEENFVHWDSTSDSDSEPEVTSVVVNPFAKRKRIDSLSSLSLKTIFSQRFLGKVPRKRRRVKVEHGFDSLLSFANNDVDDSVRRDIDSIIHNLGKDNFNDSSDVCNDANVSNDLSQDVSNDVRDDSPDVCTNHYRQLHIAMVGENLSKEPSNDASKYDDDNSDVCNDLSVNVDNDMSKDVSDDVTLGDSKVLSTDDGNDSNKVFSNCIIMDTSDESTRDVSKDITKEDTDTSKAVSDNLAQDESNDSTKDVNNDSVNDVGNDLSKHESNDNIEDNKLKHENVNEVDETTVEHSKDSEISLNQDMSINDSPKVLESTLSDDKRNDNLVSHSENDVSTEMAGRSVNNYVIDDKLDEFNDKSVDNSNESGPAAVHSNLEAENKCKYVSTVIDTVENVTENEESHDLISCKGNNNVPIEFIEHSKVKNGSLHDVCNDKDNDDSNDTMKHSNSRFKCDSHSHNHIKQTSVSNDKINEHNNDEANVINDNIYVTNDSPSLGRVGGNDSNLHEENITNDNTTSRLDRRGTDAVIINNHSIQQILNSNIDTAVIESENNDNALAASTKPLKITSYSNETKSSEDDDRRLMEALDAQIADNSGANDNCDVRNDKITLEDLMPSRDGENSLGLDSISDDDFNFDN